MQNKDTELAKADYLGICCIGEKMLGNFTAFMRDVHIK